MMKKRILTCLLILAMLLPFGTAFAATTMGDVHLTAQHDQTITLTATAFTDALDLDPADTGVTLASIAFPTLPSANLAVITQGANDYVAETAVPLSVIAAGELRARVTAPKGTRVTIPFTATLSNTDTLTADLIITLAPTAQNALHTVQAGSSTRITLGIADRIAAANYTFTLIGDDALNYGTLRATDTAGVFYYDAQTAGTDIFQFTVTLNGITSEPATVTVVVEPVEVFHYRDMVNHWAAYAAGRLAFLDKIVGQQADNRYFFFPDRGITRSDFVIWLLAVMEIEPTAEPNTLYADADIPNWMKGFLDAATEKGIIQGSPSPNVNSTSYFFPNNPVTRIEAIRMISIALGVDGHDDDLTGLFEDIEDIPGWAKNNVKHLHELQIISGDQAGRLNPMRNLSRGEAAELLYKMFKETQVNIAPPAPPAVTPPPAPVS